MADVVSDLPQVSKRELKCAENMEQTDLSPEVSNSAAPSRVSTPGYRWRQHLAAILSNLISVNSGVSVAWTASAQAVLRGEAPGSPLHLSLEEGSWVGALVPIGGLVAALPAGLLATRIGRKGALLAMGPPVIAAWLLILFAEDRAWMLYVGRFILGMSVGGGAVVTIQYNEEISEVRVRGTLGSYLDLTSSFGLLLSYILGAFLPYFWFTAASLLPVIVFLLTFTWMPESPDFLMARGRREDALRSLSWLRGPDVDLQSDLDALGKSLQQPEDPQPKKTIFGGLCSVPRVDRTTAKAVAIVLGIMFFSQANGGTAFLYYTTDVFKEAGTNVAPEIATIIVGVVYTGGTVFPTLMVDRLGRRPLLYATYLVMGLCQMSMSVYSYLDTKGQDLTDWRWVPLAALTVFISTMSMGPGPLSWFMAAEILPVSARKWGIPAGVAFGRLYVIVLIKEFPPMIEALGQDVTYGIFCVMCFLGIGFTFLCIPETKGKTREQIQMELKGNKAEAVQDDANC